MLGTAGCYRGEVILEHSHFSHTYTIANAPILISVVHTHTFLDAQGHMQSQLLKYRLTLNTLELC
jgi:hypothetical protein